MTPTINVIESLAKVLAEEARLEGKIKDTQQVLSLIKKRISESLLAHYDSTSGNKIQMPEDLMKEEQSYERLLQALQDMKDEIVKQIRPIEEQIIQASIDHLRQTFEQESRKLSECLGEVDRKILGCRQYLQEYEQARTNLQALNEKLNGLGAEPFPIPDHLPTTDLGETVKGRIDHLRSQGKL